MIKLLLLVFHIPFFYICALFQSLWGLWFFCAELIIALFLWLSTWTFQKRTHLSIKESMVVVHKNECVSNPFYVKKGSLQPGKIRLFCTLKNPYSSTSLRFNLQDSLLFTAKDCGFFSDIVSAFPQARSHNARTGSQTSSRTRRSAAIRTTQQTSMRSM